jgi:hypothetical protein
MGQMTSYIQSQQEALSRIQTQQQVFAETLAVIVRDSPKRQDVDSYGPSLNTIRYFSYLSFDVILFFTLIFDKK